MRNFIQRKINPLFPSALIAMIVVSMSFGCKSKNSTTNTSGTDSSPDVVTTSESVSEVAADTFLYYKRTPCFGMCPIFEMTIFEDGETKYSGKNFTNLIGDYRTKLDKTTLHSVIAKAEEINYFRCADVYDLEGVTDLPSIYTAIKKDGKLKWVKNRYHGPKELKLLYEHLDKIIAESKWEIQ